MRQRTKQTRCKALLADSFEGPWLELGCAEADRVRVDLVVEDRHAVLVVRGEAL